MRTIRGQLNTEINAGLDDPKIKARFADLGGMVLTGSPHGLEKTHSKTVQIELPSCSKSDHPFRDHLPTGLLRSKR